MKKTYYIIFIAAIPAADTPPDSRECSTSPPSSYGSASPPNSTIGHRFAAPRRPALGQEGRNIALRANHLEVSFNLGPYGISLLCVWQNNFGSFFLAQEGRNISLRATSFYNQGCQVAVATAPLLKSGRRKFLGAVEN
jgi:hypothetical protein